MKHGICYSNQNKSCVLSKEAEEDFDMLQEISEHLSLRSVPLPTKGKTIAMSIRSGIMSLLNRPEQLHQNDDDLDDLNVEPVESTDDKASPVYRGFSYVETTGMEQMQRAGLLTIDTLSSVSRFGKASTKNLTNVISSKSEESMTVLSSSVNTGKSVAIQYVWENQRRQPITFGDSWGSSFPGHLLPTDPVIATHTPRPLHSHLKILLL